MIVCCNYMQQVRIKLKGFNTAYRCQCASLYPYKVIRVGFMKICLQLMPMYRLYNAALTRNGACNSVDVDTKASNSCRL